MEKVICPDAGCLGCEHGEPHDFMDVDSSCTEGGDYNCPSCEEIDQPLLEVSDGAESIH